jgi:hypothetical protein
MKCYVGTWNDCRQYKCTPDYFDHIHPKDFPEQLEHYKDLEYPGKEEIKLWTNNTRIVACFNPSNVIVCYKGKTKVLDQHPKYNTWKDEMDSGELWSLFGESWVGD